MTIQNNKQYKTKLLSASKSKQAYKDTIQECLEYFVNEFNGKLSMNGTSLKNIVEICGKDVKDLREWLFKYTNMTKVKADCIHFETDDYAFNRNNEKIYNLKFKDNFNGQKWFETAEKTDKQAIKDFTNENFLRSLRLMINNLKSDRNKTTVDCAAFLRSAEVLETRLKATIENK